MTLPTDIATYLAACGRGTLAINIFIGTLPDQPSNAVAVSGGGGLGPRYAMGSSGAVVAFDYAAVQILVRNSSYAAAETLALAIMADLEAVQEDDLSGTRYHSISPKNAYPAFWRDENNRVVMSLNFEVIKQR